MNPRETNRDGVKAFLCEAYDAIYDHLAYNYTVRDEYDTAFAALLLLDGIWKEEKIPNFERIEREIDSMYGMRKEFVLHPAAKSPN